MEPETAAKRNPSEMELMRKWVENWKRVGPELEKIKREELRKLTGKKAYQDAVSLMKCLEREFWIDPRRRESSGLVEQQEIFQRARASAK